MSKTKFTPGPWKIVEDRVPSSLEVYGGTIAICECWRRANAETEMANAHLIAAAPELYEALEECAIDLKEWILNRYPEESLKYPSIKKDFELDISIVDKAFAALAKARGESHD